MVIQAVCHYAFFFFRRRNAAVPAPARATMMITTTTIVPVLLPPLVSDAELLPEDTASEDAVESTDWASEESCEDAISEETADEPASEDTTELTAVLPDLLEEAAVELLETVADEEAVLPEDPFLMSATV